MGKHQGWQEEEKEGKMWARIFIMVPMKKNGWGRVSRLRIG